VFVPEQDTGITDEKKDIFYTSRVVVKVVGGGSKKILISLFVCAIDKYISFLRGLF